MFDGIDDDVGVSRFRDNNNNTTAKRNKIIKKSTFLVLYLFFLARYRLCDPSPFFRYFKWFSEKKQKQDHLKKKLEDQEIKNLFFIQQKKNYFFNHLQKK